MCRVQLASLKNLLQEPLTNTHTLDQHTHAHRRERERERERERVFDNIWAVKNIHNTLITEFNIKE